MRAVKVAAEIASAGRILARHRCEALIAWEPAFEVEGGVVLDARVSHQLLLAIHMPDRTNPLRGLTVVRGSRIERAAVPMTWDDLMEHASELATGIAVAIKDTGDIRWFDRRGEAETVAPLHSPGRYIGVRRRSSVAEQNPVSIRFVREGSRPARDGEDRCC